MYYILKWCYNKLMLFIEIVIYSKTLIIVHFIMQVYRFIYCTNHHDHFTSDYIDLICNKCNVVTKEKRWIIHVIAYETRNNYQNFILRELAEYNAKMIARRKIENVIVIPKNDRNFYIDSHSY